MYHLLMKVLAGLWQTEHFRKAAGNILSVSDVYIDAEVSYVSPSILVAQIAQKKKSKVPGEKASALLIITHLVCKC